MRTHIIDWSDTKYVIVREPAIRMCDGNVCAAALLSYLQYVYEWKLEHVQERSKEWDYAISRSKDPTHEASLWHSFTIQELVDRLLIYDRKSVMSALELLQKKGFADVKPSAHAPSNRRVILLNLESVMLALYEIRLSKK